MGSLVLALLLCTSPLHSTAQTPAEGWPARPIRLLIPFAAGGAVDTTARLIALRMSESTGRPVVAENRPGASGMIAVEALLKAPADGHTGLVGAAAYSPLPLRDRTNRSMTRSRTSNRSA
jgi:tripartite-type tricarboxylate transporter receptor subunit TctC